MITLILVSIVLLATAQQAWAHGGVPRKVDRALHHASRQYRVPYWEMRAVSLCESHWRPWAVGAGSYGLFQFLPSTWRRTPYRHRYILSGWWNAHAAAWLVRHDGYSWREWTCGRVLG